MKIRSLLSFPLLLSLLMALLGVSLSRAQLANSGWPSGLGTGTNALQSTGSHTIPKLKWLFNAPNDKYFYGQAVVGIHGRLSTVTGAIALNDAQWIWSKSQIPFNFSYTQNIVAGSDGTLYGLIIGDPGKSLTVAIDGATGFTKWQQASQDYLLSVADSGQVFGLAYGKNSNGADIYTLTAYDPQTGNILWQIGPSTGGISLPYLTSEGLLLSRENTDFTWRVPATGALVRKTPVTGGSITAPTTFGPDGNFYSYARINGFDGIQSYSGKDGSFQGNMIVDHDSRKDLAISQDGAVITTGNDFALRAIDFKSKVVKWTFIPPDLPSNTYGSYVSNLAVSSDNVIHVLYNYSGKAYVYAIDALTGNLIWQYYAGNGFPTYGIVLASDGTLFAGYFALDSIHVINVSMNASSVIGGHSSTGTVTLNYAAPKGGITVSLGSNQSAAIPPTLVTVPEGQTSVTFTVATVPVSTKTVATITANPGIDQTTDLTILPASVRSLTLSPTTVVGGNPVTGTVVLTDAAGPKGNIVTLSSDSSFAQVPATMTVAAGKTSGTFTVATSGVDISSVANITASSGGGSATSPVTVTPPGVQSIALNPTSVSGGNNSTGTITLSGLAGPSGLVVSLKSDNPAASVPGTVTISAGKTSAIFTIATSGVDAVANANISASINNTSQSALLTIIPAKLATFTLSPTTVKGGSPSTGTATLNGQAGPSGVTINLTSDNSAAIVPATILVSPGKTSATVIVNTTGVDSQIIANVAAELNGTKVSAKLTITPTSLGSITINPTSVVGGNNATGTVTLNGLAGPSGVVVALSSGSSSVSVPATVTVASGSNSANFVVTTLGVDSQVNASVSASYNGVNQSASLGVTPASLVSLTLNPSTVLAGTNSAGTVTLDGKAGPSGKTISLTSSSQSASLPNSVVIAPGATTANFIVTTSGVDSLTTATVSGKSGSVTQSATLTIQPSNIASLTLNPTTVTGGSSSTATLTLNGPAGPSGTQIAVASDSSFAFVPSAITVPAGKSSATFTVTTSGVNSQIVANINASAATISKSASLTITSSTVINLSLSPASVIGGGNSIGTVTLSGPAASGGTIVVIASSSSAANVPASITVPAGATTTTFNVSTVGVTSTTTANIKATLGNSSQTASLSIAPATLSSLVLTPPSVAGGNNFNGSITLSGNAGPGGVVVSLSSSNPAVNVPSTVTIPAGSGSAVFSGGTSIVLSTVQATITARWGNSTLTATETVSPPILVGISVSPSTVNGGNSSTGQVGLNGAAPKGGLTVKLSSSDKSVIVPSTVSIPAGASSANFVVKTTAVSLVKTVTITGTLALHSVSTTLIVNPPVLHSLSLNPTSVVGGTSSTGTATISGPAPSTGLVVKLSSNIGAAITPTSVTIPGGKLSATFVVKTLAVSTTNQAVISGSLNGVTLTANLTIKAPVLSALSVSPAIVTGGKNATGTVTISSPAPASGLSILISSDHPEATVPGSVTILSGKTSAKFTVKTVKVSVKTTVNITGSLNGVSKTAKVIVQ